MNKRKILIATGIYPPALGGPSKYAQNIERVYREKGFTVKVLTFKLEKYLPTGVRHSLFFFRTVFALRGVQFVFALDTFSTGFPAVLAAKIFKKKIIIRTGGDFLWESYVERTGELVLLKDFYKKSLSKLSLKEKLIFKVTGWTLRNCSALIFSTVWQKDIFLEAYKLNPEKIFIIENYYGDKIPSFEAQKKNFVAGTRSLKWKNHSRLKKAFEREKVKEKGLIYDAEKVSHKDFIAKIQHSYAVIVVSLGDISPNTILEAIRCNKPFILTRETGLYEKLKNVGLFVDPENIDDIEEKLLTLSNEEIYNKYRKKVEEFDFRHSWEEISNEILDIYSGLS